MGEPGRCRVCTFLRIVVGAAATLRVAAALARPRRACPAAGPPVQAGVYQQRAGRAAVRCALGGAAHDVVELEGGWMAVRRPDGNEWRPGAG